MGMRLDLLCGGLVYVLKTRLDWASLETAGCICGYLHANEKQ